MPTLEISEDALAALQTLKRIPTETDVAALDRILRELPSDRDQKLSEYCQQEPDTHSTN